MEHTETNEDWEKRFESLDVFSAPLPNDKSGAWTFVCDIQKIKDFIHSLRQSDKELILGKMEGEKKQFIKNEGHEDDNFEIQGFNQALDTCKSIVEETLK